MERNTATTIKNLKFGDRFYKPSDKKKEVWQYLAYKNRRYMCERDNDMHPTPFLESANVVFLRAAKDEMN